MTSLYVWRVVEILAEVKTSLSGDGWTYTTFSYAAPGTKRDLGDVAHPISAYDKKDPIDVAWALNKHRADWLDHEVDSLRRYIKWQTERVAAWAPAPLIPVVQVLTPAERVGFIPTPARY